eukprot:gene13631-9762_t
MYSPFSASAESALPDLRESPSADRWLADLSLFDESADASCFDHTSRESSDAAERPRQRRLRPHRKRKSSLVVARHRHTIDVSGAIGGALPLAQLHSRVFHDGEPHELRGVPSLVRVLCGMFVLHPDQVFSAGNVRVVSRAGDASSRVECDFRIAYRLLYDVHPVAFTDHIFEAAGIDEDASSDAFTGAAPSPDARAAASALMTLSTPPQRSPFQSPFDPFAYFNEKVGYAMPRRAEPLPIALQMQFAIHLDEARRMCRLEASMLRCEAGAEAAPV